MLRLIQKSFGGNRENRLKKKNWEAKEGIKLYKSMTDPGMDMGGNRYSNSQFVLDKTEKLKNNPGEARRTYRNMRDWSIDKKRAINSEIVRKSMVKDGGFSINSHYMDNDLRINKVIPEVTEKYLQKSQTFRLQRHNPQKYASKPQVIKNKIPKKSILNSITSIFKKVRA